MGCRDDLGRYTADPMDNTPWQIRMKEAGLTQRTLARLCGKPDNTISRQLRGEFGDVPGYIVAIILAWEGMSEGARADWTKAVEAELDRREK
jgi:transcriptional regulator with XRE-family HTH domain